METPPYVGGSLRGKGARSLRDLTRSLRAAYVRHVISLYLIICVSVLTRSYENLTSCLRAPCDFAILHRSVCLGPLLEIPAYEMLTGSLREAYVKF